MKLIELKTSKNYHEIPKVKDKIEIVYHSDYWDGIISGIIRINDVLFWLDMIEENEEDDDWYRKFGITRISQSQLDKELKVHRDFQRYVGTNCDIIFLRPPPKFEHGKKEYFYMKHESYIYEKNFDDNELIGWMVS